MGLSSKFILFSFGNKILIFLNDVLEFEICLCGSGYDDDDVKSSKHSEILYFLLKINSSDGREIANRESEAIQVDNSSK